MTELTLNNVTKVYDDAQGTDTAVNSLDVEVEDGEFVVFVGPSGCGKSTTLRMIAGLETVTDGTINIGDRAVHHLIPSERNIAMVFQSYALYSKMTAQQNLAYGLKHSSDLGKQEREHRVREIAELLDISELLDDVPSEMSGGQKQRVALGRAIVRDPDVFLLDEPLSNLDAKLRARMRTELQQLHDELGVTTVYVTHDQTEAMTMGDRIAIMNDGKLQQIAPPEEAYDHPVNEFVATFLGSPAMNTVDVTVSTEDETFALKSGETTLATVPAEEIPLEVGETVRFGIRPEALQIGASANGFKATVSVSEYQGNDNFVHLTAAGHDLIARVPPAIYPDPEETVDVFIDPVDVYLFDPDTGESLKTHGLVDESTRKQNTPKQH